MESFNSDRESIAVYLEWVQLYFEANGIKAKNQVSVFLNPIGWEKYKLLRNLTTPEKLARKLLNDLMDILKKQYKPKTLSLLRISISSVAATAWSNSRNVFV